jgi:hypothetical protein
MKGGKLKQQKCSFKGFSLNVRLQTTYATRQYAMHYEYIFVERIQDYGNKWHDHILRMDSLRLIHRLRITGFWTLSIVRYSRN